MPVGQLIARGRSQFEKLMTDACAITRTTGTTVGAGGVTSTTTSTVYSGKCRIAASTGGSWTEVGEESRVLSRLRLQLPVSAPDLAEGDKVTITASTYDPLLIGKKFAVTHAARMSLSTRVEVAVTELTS